MERELAKWILDIAKYMVTALLLTTVFSDMSSPKVLIFGLLGAIICMICGLWILKNQDKKDRQREKNRNKRK